MKKDVEFESFCYAGVRPEGEKLKVASGFTLIEMLVYVVVASMIAGVLTAFAFWSIRVGSKVKTDSEILDNARRAMETMTYEIRNSKSVYTPTSVFGSHPGQISLEQATSTPPGETKTFIDFFICGEALCQKREGMAPIALTGAKVRVTNLLFSRLENSTSTESIKINLVVEPLIWPGPSDQARIQLETTANTRLY